jgi:hypothetical protein
MFCQELAAQLERDVRPKLEEAGVRCVVVGIGTVDAGREFCAHVGVEPAGLLADPTNAAYSALGLNAGLGTLVTWDTSFSFLRRARDGSLGDIARATARWKPILPPRADQGLQQGGAFVFEGRQLLFRHVDAGTGAHAELDDVLRAALARGGDE